MVVHPGFAQHQNGADGIHETLSTIVNGVIQFGTIGEQAAAGAITIVIRNPNNGHLEAYSEVIRDSITCPLGAANPFVVDMVAIALPRPNLAQNRTTAITDAGLSMYYGWTKEPFNSANAALAAAMPPAGHYNVKGIYGSVERHVHATSTNLIDANIPAFPLPPGNAPANGYGCCEGQIIARLFDNDVPAAVNEVNLHPLFPQVIQHLIDQADAHRANNHQVTHITDNNIILVILHIHTHQDPCAKCSKVLSGLSRQMNMPAHNIHNQHTQTQQMTNLLNNAPFHNAIPNLIANLRAGNARFLTEVSSDTCYHLRIGANHPCSHAEIAGHDGGQANAINVNTGGGIINFAGPVNIHGGQHQLNIPGINNWIFPNTFPPYVIYKRINAIQNPCVCANPHHMQPLPPANLGVIN